jgi:hypothetical protein
MQADVKHIALRHEPQIDAHAFDHLVAAEVV